MRYNVAETHKIAIQNGPNTRETGNIASASSHDTGTRGFGAFFKYLQHTLG